MKIDFITALNSLTPVSAKQPACMLTLAPEYSSPLFILDHHEIR